MAQVIIVSADDWQGIYVDGAMLWQHHDIEEYGWVELHNKYPGEPWVEHYMNEAGYDWLCLDRRLPERFEDIPARYYE